MNASNKAMMQQIVRKVGEPQAIQMVMKAYDTEIIGNKLARLEHAVGGQKLTAKRDHLELALRRVIEVLELTGG